MRLKDLTVGMEVALQASSLTDVRRAYVLEIGGWLDTWGMSFADKNRGRFLPHEGKNGVAVAVLGDPCGVFAGEWRADVVQPARILGPWAVINGKREAQRALSEAAIVERAKERASRAAREVAVMVRFHKALGLEFTEGVEWRSSDATRFVGVNLDILEKVAALLPSKE